ncbi:hypothetical protein BSPWISOXPB_7563 [uncultured Gammaproteobacteria bacterium]|nr:hypothetical protein BSPWISOXPB_7563 [uncultured Gammaproteobacteria bacterium]
MLSIPINTLNHTLEQSSKFAHNLILMSAAKKPTLLCKISNPLNIEIPNKEWGNFF